jgi:undecaprenyl-diphosphatase
MVQLRFAAIGGALTVFALFVPCAAQADPPREPGQHFTIDPVADGVVTAAGAGFSGMLALVLSTGEITPTPPGPKSNLLGIDQGAVTQTIDPHAETLSTVGLWTAVGFAVLDPIFSGLRDGWDAGLVDALMYAESLAVTVAMTDITKIAVRRPRPIDYINCPSGTTTCTSTDLELSFFSGHAAAVAAVSATATYLAFVRSPHSPRPWITMGAGALLTAFVSYERVRAGAHFPTDVIAGSMAGAAVGVLVPHLHRHQEEAPPVWIGLSPVREGGGTVTLQGYF